MKTFANHDKASKSVVQTGRQSSQPVNYHNHYTGYQKCLPEICYILHSSIIQPSLTISQPSDPYEQEADQVAAQVMRMPEPTVQRKPEDEEKEKIQTKLIEGGMIQTEANLLEGEVLQDNTETPITKSIPTVANRIKSLKGNGNPLPDTVRADFEPKFGADFGKVRIHTGSEAVHLNKQINSQAFTVGSDIFFNEGIRRGRFLDGGLRGDSFGPHQPNHAR